jgi:hypothetical protein
MVYNIRDYWVLGLGPSSGILKTLRLETGRFSPQVRGWDKNTRLGPSVTLCTLEYQTTDKIQKCANRDCYSPGFLIGYLMILSVMRLYSFGNTMF